MISNPYGYKETIPVLDFLNRMAFADFDKYPAVQQLVLSLGMIPGNMYFLVKAGN